MHLVLSIALSFRHESYQNALCPTMAIVNPSHSDSMQQLGHFPYGTAAAV
jgi:hypothetical protein